ncbi:uncharacterized protein SOCE26_030640 [Sorangium cellulosum]|uniref:Uncharacterized protein n=1 Tax=Sorangium cellulosum TaxID=56 RepID=A0A2L0EQW0_SORCE|nr:uncharacterized protein SOCE26_030640 [Sorangium cellulosum]
MAPRLPLSVKLTRRAVAQRDLFCELVQKAVRPCQADAAFAFHAFAFKADEDGFARELMDTCSARRRSTSRCRGTGRRSSRGSGGARASARRDEAPLRARLMAVRRALDAANVLAFRSLRSAERGSGTLLALSQEVL